ncbi:hypothetical protein [Parendozoicomonas sp. Alg238-R29]|uniref:hypothetical protein n=1 Tax=Parendozoicomonas sp. Alg238-R29 TaxID=2993446 RepID=UPI00248F397B|nr:hypothetical protein [Parendozoicomonas sp. Alg238-R29]
MSKYKEWANLKEKVWQDLSNGARSPAPLLYLITIIIVAGGVGVWFPITQGSGDIKANLMTYVFALISAILADFLLEEKDKTQSYNMLVISIVVVIIALTVYTITASGTGNLNASISSYIPIGIATILLWTVWWILIPKTKFDLEQETIKSSTIGTPEPASNAKNRSLSALKSARKAEGSNNE